MEWKWDYIFPRLSDFVRTYRVALFVFGIILLAVSIHLIPQKPTVGKIEKPHYNQEVPRLVYIQGTINHLPKSHSLWVAVQKGELFWPKLPKITPTKSKWASTLFEDGTPPKGRFSVVLLSATPSANEELEKWINDGDYSGIPKNKIPGVVVLDDVSVRRISYK
jgi:hypothetical protein